MKSIVRCGSLLALVLAAAPALADDQIPWVADFSTACGMAAEQRRLVLLHFYNDNCGPCVRLEQNVFNKPEVAEAVAQNYLAVKVHAGKNPQLAQRYGINQWPTDVFTSASGLEVFRTVSPQKPADYIAVLNQVAKQTGVGNSRQWKSQMAQVLQPAANTASDAANVVTTDAKSAAKQATTDAKGFMSGAEGRWDTTASQFQKAADQAKATANQSAQQVQTAAQQTQQQAATVIANTEARTKQWSQQANDAMQHYQQQAGDAYQQFRQQTAQAEQQVQQQAETTRQEWQSTTQKATQELSAASNQLTNELQQASNSLLDRRSAFTPTESSPATSPATASLTALAATATPGTTTSATPAKAADSIAPVVSPSSVAVQVPNLTENPWVAEKQRQSATSPAQVPQTSPRFVPAQPQTVVPASATVSQPLVPASQAPPLALDGFCPVTLAETMARNPNDRGAWKKGDKQFGAIHQGRTYLFTSAEQQQKFLANPELYAPVLAGCDPVVYAERGQLIHGKRAYGLVTPDKHVYLFADEASLTRFQQSPTRYAAAVQQAMARSAVPGVYR